MFNFIVLPSVSNLTMYTLGENVSQLGILFAACGIYGECEQNKQINQCLKTNLKIASGLMITSSLLKLYRINRI